MSEPIEIKIDDEGDVDVDAIMQQIREHIAARRQQTATPGMPDASPRFEGRFDSAVYENLYYASLLHDRLNPPPQVIASRIPIIGAWLTALRRKLHEVTLFYVAQLAQKQGTVNAHLLNAMNTLVRDLENDPNAEVVELKHEIETLRQRVQALEEKK